MSANPNTLSIRAEDLTVGNHTATLIQLFNGGWWVRFDAPTGYNNEWGKYAAEFPTLQEARVYAVKMLMGGLK